MKDYARRNREQTIIPNRRYAKAKTMTFDRLLIIFIISALAFAAISACVTLFQKHQAEKAQITPQPVALKTDKHGAKTATPTKEIAENTQPKYDFYQMLPKITVDVEKPKKS